jgi:ectoine hydroxylase
MKELGVEMTMSDLMECQQIVGSPSQLRAYEENGFLLVPEVFAAGEIAQLKTRLPTIFAEDSPRRIMEKDGSSVRSVYGVHFTDPLFRRLTRDCRILDCAKRIIGGDLYVHQVKINSKVSFKGDIWDWHQDYILA